MRHDSKKPIFIMFYILRFEYWVFFFVNLFYHMIASVLTFFYTILTYSIS